MGKKINYLMSFDKQDQLEALRKTLVSHNEPFQDEIMSFVAKISDLIEILFKLARKSKREVFQLGINRYILGATCASSEGLITIQEHIRKIVSKANHEIKEEAERACQILVKIRNLIMEQSKDEKGNLLAGYATEYIGAISSLQKRHKEEVAHHHTLQMFEREKQAGIPKSESKAENYLKDLEKRKMLI